MNKKPIGIFDSGYGGLTVLREIKDRLPDYDYIYLGDNARTPYGSRSYDVVYEYTLQAVKTLFNKGCELVILACNTASAKALRTIQQNDLPRIAPDKRVLGVIRPSTERAREFTKTGHIGVLGTDGTVQSESYPIEIEKFCPEISVKQQACPMWVPIIENNVFNTYGGDFFIEYYLQDLFKEDNDIDALILACTHYPIIKEQIESHVPKHVKVISQGPLVAESLEDYLRRHPEMESRISKSGSVQFFTSEKPINFNNKASLFYGEDIHAEHLLIG